MLKGDRAVIILGTGQSITVLSTLAGSVDTPAAAMTWPKRDASYPGMKVQPSSFFFFSYSALKVSSVGQEDWNSRQDSLHKVLESGRSIAEAERHHSKLPQPLADVKSLGMHLWGQLHLPVVTVKVKEAETARTTYSRAPSTWDSVDNRGGLGVHHLCRCHAVQNLWYNM